MLNLDFAPLYRSTVGFDHLAAMLDEALQQDQRQLGYPPYNIELTGEDKYRITMAIAGFDQSELNIVAENNTLTVSGKKAEQDEKQFLHHGIAERNFERKFQLADYVEINAANLENGLLHINLVRVIPDAMKPKTIEIKTVTPLINNMEKQNTTKQDTIKQAEAA